MTKYNVMICRFPGNGWEHNECTTWLMGLMPELKSDPRIGQVGTKVICDTPVTMSRNRAVKYSQVLKADYILMVDSDMGPDYLVGRDPAARPFWSTAWDFMMNRREAEAEYATALRRAAPKDRKNRSRVPQEEYESSVRHSVFAKFPPATIAAPYCGPPPDECCYMFHWKSYQDGAPLETFKLEMIEREDAARRSGIEEVAAMATGLILYDARLFDVLPPPWFRYEWEDKDLETNKATTEDVYQTRNASMLKMPQYCLWDSWATHWKWKGVGRPSVLYKDAVHESLVQAVERGWISSEKLSFRHKHDVPRAKKTP